MKINKTLVFIVAGIILILAVSGLYFTRKTQTNTPNKKTSGIDQNNNLIPTVDASVQVQFSIDSGKKDAILVISGIPNGSQTIDFELSYEEKKKGLQGAFGSISLNGERTYEKRIKDAFATCSSGRCIYHDIISKIKVNLSFTGSYDQKIFEKEY